MMVPGFVVLVWVARPGSRTPPSRQPSVRVPRSVFGRRPWWCLTIGIVAGGWIVILLANLAPALPGGNGAVGGLVCAWGVIALYNTVNSGSEAAFKPWKTG